MCRRPAGTEPRPLSAPRITLELRDDVLFAGGSAPAAWIESARRRAESVPGPARLDTTGVTDETEQLLEAKRKALESSALAFSEGLTLAPEAAAAVVKVAAQIEDLRRAALDRGSTLHVSVIGHTSPEGPERLNSSLAKNRADEIVRLLADQGIHPSLLAPQGAAIAQPGQPPAEEGNGAPHGRSVTFHMTIGQRTATKTAP